MLNKFKHLKLRSFKVFLGLLFFLLAGSLNFGCGKRKPPLPPKERVVQRAQISGLQRGNEVILSWTMPARNAAETNLLNIDRVDIYRLAEPLSKVLSLTTAEFASRSTLIASRKVTAGDFGLKKMTYSDPLAFTGQPARLIYAVRFVNSSGQKADFSNFLLVEPTARVAQPPVGLTAETTEPAIQLSWLPPPTNIDQTSPANILGYNVYRREIDTATEAQKITPDPLTTNAFTDQNFLFGRTYEYFVRTVSVGREGVRVESIDSKMVRVSPVDIFPPAPPEAITIAAAPNNLSIFFAASPEKDLAGYTLYRSTDINLPLPEWEKLTSDLLNTNTYQDRTVESGKTYYYYLTATDTAGNTSSPSEIVFETAP